jgi:uncharacterized membrane protein YedE/YeeE
MSSPPPDPRTLGSLVRVGVIGLLFGAVLSQAGFTSWDDLAAMFRLADLRLLFSFGFAVAVLAVGWAVIRRVQHPRWTVRLVHPGTIPGAVLFGVGWALSGACPSAVAAQLGEGQLGAAFTLLGMVVGNALYGAAHTRWFRWSQASCADR